MKSPELISLEATRESLKASIAARKKQAAPSPDFQAVTRHEENRLAEIEARIAEIIGAPAPPASEESTVS